MGRRGSATHRERRIARALHMIEARIGTGVVRRLAVHRPDQRAPAVPSGSLSLDLATGVGVLPRGHLTELLGPPSSGKTALLYGALAATQRAGGLAALIDAEGSADGDALAACGVDLDELLLARPASAQDALLLLTILARCGGLDALGLASIAALRDLPPPVPSPSALDDLRSHDVARLLSRGLRVLMTALRGAPTAVIVTNEVLSHPPGHHSIGGLALRHFAALRVAVEPRTLIPDTRGGVRALRVGLTVVKSKVGPPGGGVEVELAIGGGVDRTAEILALGLTMGLIERGPLGLVYGREPLGRSPEVARRRLAADGPLAEALAGAIVASHSHTTAA